MSTNAERFGKIVKDRRLELDMNQLDVHAAGGPSNSKLTDIENGRLEDLTRLTARKLDRALRWEVGSARDTWQGGDPRPILAPGLSSGLSETLRAQISAADLDPKIRKRMLDLLDQADAG